LRPFQVAVNIGIDDRYAYTLETAKKNTKPWQMPGLDTKSLKGGFRLQ